MPDYPPQLITYLRLGKLFADHHRTSELTVQGKSMGPLFSAPVRVLLEHGTGSLRPGDVMVYTTGADIVAHRLLAVRWAGRGRFYLAKGDANPNPDPPVPEQAVIGRALGILAADGLQPLARRRAAATLTLCWLAVRPHVPWRARTAGRRILTWCRRKSHVR